MSLSDAERSESYPIEKSCSKYSFLMETDALTDVSKRYTIIVAYYHKWKRRLTHFLSSSSSLSEISSHEIGCIILLIPLFFILLIISIIYYNYGINNLLGVNKLVI